MMDEPQLGIRDRVAGPSGNGIESRRRVLVVDDDPALRLLLRTTLALDAFLVEEVASAEEAMQVARSFSPSVVLLDVTLPGMDGLAFARRLSDDPSLGCPSVILLTGAEVSDDEAHAARADGVLRKPFSPLELVRLLEGLDSSPAEAGVPEGGADAGQLLMYAHDLGRLLELERLQHRLLQEAYRETVAALADALEAKDPQTGFHAQRVRAYALVLTEAVDPSLLEDASLEYGFLLHDVGKIAIPNNILSKRGPLTAGDWALIRTHPSVGASILSGVTLLGGRGIEIVNFHHERWDGGGYPSSLAGEGIPIGARIFAVADALDAMTSARPYREPFSWQEANQRLLAETGGQFDPDVIRAYAASEERMYAIYEQFAATGPPLPTASISLRGL
jgi:ribonuclease P protein subunit RPR2